MKRASTLSYALFLSSKNVVQNAGADLGFSRGGGFRGFRKLAKLAKQAKTGQIFEKQAKKGVFRHFWENFDQIDQKNCPSKLYGAKENFCDPS